MQRAAKKSSFGRSALGVFAFGFLLAAACSGPTQASGNVATCRFDATTTASSATGDCSANRTFISCTNRDGSGELCLSDNVNACPNETPNGSCTNECQPSEYAAACGGLPGADGGAPNSNPPSPTCHFLTGLPNGEAIYCCPCGS